MQYLNKRARFNYKLEKERFEAGLVLKGAEVKAIKTGHIDLTKAHVRIINNEAWLINALIPIPNLKNYDAKRSKKLLLRKQEIISFLVKIKQKNLTLVPVSVYTRGRLVKVKIALGKQKRKFEKRELIKKKTIEREIAQSLKSQNR